MGIMDKYGKSKKLVNSHIIDDKRSTMPNFTRAENGVGERERETSTETERGQNESNSELQ